MTIRFAVSLIAASLITAATGYAQTDSAAPLNRLIQEALDDGIIVGAQSAVGASNGPVEIQDFGVTAPGSDRRVDGSTLFGIGSCSKPFASACLLSLVEAGTIELDEPIDRWLPEFGDLKLVDGTPSPRAPTLRELLAHRSGIYSQKQGPMTPAQTRAIRDFRLTLDESVQIVAHQPLTAAPGQSYAYSGAGYCVLGRVAEAAAERSFEEVFQERIAIPLQLKRTTYFPRPDDANVAAGGAKVQGDVRPHPQTPHRLGDKLALPLIGGSLHSTAAETSRFARMILSGGTSGERTVLSPESMQELTRRQYDGQTYGLGWSLAHVDGKLATMQHNGALFGNRSLLYLDVEHGTFAVVHWTLAEAGGRQGQQLVRQFVEAAKQVTAH